MSRQELIALAALFMMLGSGVGILIDGVLWSKAAIRHGAAHYHPETGAFTWNDEEKTK